MRTKEKILLGTAIAVGVVDACVAVNTLAKKKGIVIKDAVIAFGKKIKKDRSGEEPNEEDEEQIPIE